MRNRTPDSTTPSLAHPPAAEPTPCPPPRESADCWVWFVTEKGLRASGAASMQATAAGLRESAAELEKAARRLSQHVPGRANGSGEAPPRVLRRATVTYRYRGEHQVPELRLGGKWLRRAGFELGQKVAVKVEDGRLTICTE